MNKWTTFASLIGAVLLACTSTSAALAPAKSITQYAQDVWGADAGLNNNSVTSIAQTPDGYLWLGTEEGLARFDGVRFTVFDKQNTPSIKSNQISALLADSQRNLWIGTDGGGLIRLTDGKFKAYSIRDGLSSDAILSLYQDKKGILWIGTNGGGLFRFQDGLFTRYTSESGLPDAAVFSISGGQDGSLWLGTHAGLAHLVNGAIKSYTKKDGLSDNYIKSVCVGRRGDVWVGTNGGGLNRLLNGRFVNYTTRDGLSSNAIWSVYEDSSGTLWVGTIDAGLSQFRDGQFSTYSARDGLPANRVLNFLEDKEGNLWIGTGGAGLVRLKNGAFTTFTTREGLSDDVVLPVYEDRQGAILVGTNGGGLNCLRNGRITTYTTQNGLRDNVVFSIAEDKEGSLWIATRSGLDRLKAGKFTVFTTSNGLPTNIVLALYLDREGILWAGSRGGLSRFDGNRFKTYTTRDGLSNDHITSIYEDAGKTLWVGTGGGGLNKFDRGRFLSYSTRDGLSSDAVRSISGDASGTLWIGTTGGGLDRFKDGKFTAYTTRDGLLDDDILQILSDRNGYLWMGSNKGVFRVSKRQLNAYAEGRLGFIKSISYGTSDGLKNKECNGGFQPAGWQTKDGRLLFPTMKGLAIVDPGRLGTNRPPPPVVVESITIDALDFDPRKPIEAKPGKGELEFTFTAPSLVSSKKICFKYKLDGFDKAWIEAGHRRTAYYTNIPPGAYRFAVTASNPDSEWNSEGASVVLTLRPHFYQTYVFLAFCTTLAAALCFGIYGLRIRSLRANEKRLIRLVDDKTQALQEQIRAKEKAHGELAEAQQSLIELSRRSGMAEVATGVLHNVGNVLNSVNVGAGIVTSKVREFRVDNLSTALKMLEEHTHDLSSFVEKDPKGQRVLPYLVKLAQHLQGERNQVLHELESLTEHIDHIKEVVAIQQDYAKASALTEIVSIPKLLDQALAMVEASLTRHHVEVIREIDDVPDLGLAKHKVIEILVNLIRNAKQAVLEQNGPVREVRIKVKRYSPDRIRIEIHDSGVGLSPENLTRIFAHGFTTKSNGHGFGLHSGALAAKQMGGSLWAESKGTGLGATFVLELPATVAVNAPAMSTT